MRKNRMAAAMIAAAVMMGMTGCKNQTAATETTKETVTWDTPNTFLLL